MKVRNYELSNKEDNITMFAMAQVCKLFSLSRLSVALWSFNLYTLR